MEDTNQFNNWVDQWDKAVKDGIFNNIPKQELDLKTNEPSRESFFGDLNINTNSTPSDEEVGYWNDVSKYSEETNILNENKKINKSVKTAANTPNPVVVDTVGKDTNKPSKKGFASNKTLEQLEELKNKLHSLENEMLTKEALGKDFKKVEKEMEKVYSIIDKLSNELNQGKFETDSE